MSVQCTKCGSPNADDATFCTNCGTPITAAQPPIAPPGGMQMQQKICTNCQRPIDINLQTCPYCGVVQPSAAYPNYPQTQVPVGSKNKVTAGLLALFLGGLGVHKFYLGQTGLGILYLVLCWTGIPSIIALIEGIIYLTMSDMDFYQKYH